MIPLMTKLVAASFMGGAALEGTKSAVRKVKKRISSSGYTEEEIQLMKKNEAEFKDYQRRLEIEKSERADDLKRMYGGTFDYEISQFISNEINRGVNPMKVAREAERRRAEHEGRPPKF